jgi:hypothetical protein
MTSTADLGRQLARYAARMHAAAGGVHHIASPAGAWLLAALCASVAADAGDEVAAELTFALGTRPATAAAQAAALLDPGHPAVLSAAGLWIRERARTPGVDRWRAALPATVATGDVPSQEKLDAWADEHTLGLIRRFPVEVDHATLLVLATALATKVTWQRPFDLVPAQRLGAGGVWAGGVERVLATPAGGHGHEQFVATTATAGDVAVHTARAEQELTVTSVVAAPDVPPAEVLAAAYEIATGVVTGPRVSRRSLFDLPLGASALWTVREEAARTTAPDGREERCTAVLPAWSATSSHDLDRPELGVPAAARAAATALGLPEHLYTARQAVTARYSRTGFEAAAVSAFAVATGMPMYRDGVLRTAELRFPHPYAVVAVATQQSWDSDRDVTVVGPWHGLPVFSAWVAEVDDAA